MTTRSPRERRRERRLPRRREWARAALAAVLGAILVTGPIHAQPRGPGRVSATATLTVLAGTVDRVPAGQKDPQPASSGASLAVGDRVLTKPGATALITFLDGSTVTVQPDSD